MATHFGRINAMAQGKVPRRQGGPGQRRGAERDRQAALGRLPGRLQRGNTEAKPEVWSQPDKFKSGAQLLIDNVAKLDAAAKAGSLDQIKAAAGEVGKSCKACHETFKKD
jgi:cytochrome c556